MVESSNTLLIGVDGGGTGCRVIIADGHQTVLAEAEGGPANVATDFTRAIDNIQQAIARTAERGGIDSADLRGAFVHIGLAGVLSDDTASRIRNALAFANASITDDRPTAVAGALGDSDGFLVAVGTGSFLASRQGEQNRYMGGWGFHVGDQASGAWLGRRLLEETLLRHDGLRPHTDLSRTVMARFGNDPNRLVAFSLTARPGDYGHHAPAVVKASKAGDPLGSSLMREGAGYLRAGLGVLGYSPGQTLCLTGGLGSHYAALLGSDDPASDIIAPRGSTVSGAVRLAALAARTAIGGTS